MKNTDRLRSLKIGEHYVFPPGKKDTLRTTRDRLQRKNLGRWVIDGNRITRVSLPLSEEEKDTLKRRIKGILLGRSNKKYLLSGDINGLHFEGAGGARDVDGEPVSFSFNVDVEKFDNEFDVVISNEYFYEKC